ncbi:unnamed protein product [Paramecium octaurelia]|uniref:Uncharacterized protein n=1 Tax=Paramecium octaurelia TaxID=43137 RepID=A0A8S1YR30_PAROT|nr:unnamed protein product [Paramecium octaurelia]
MRVFSQLLLVKIFQHQWLGLNHKLNDKTNLMFIRTSRRVVTLNLLKKLNQFIFGRYDTEYGKKLKPTNGLPNRYFMAIFMMFIVQYQIIMKIQLSLEVRTVILSFG